MKRSCLVLVLFSGLMVLPLMAQEKVAETNAPATATATQVPLDETALLAKRNALIEEATRHNGMIRAIRDRAMKQDKELVKLTGEIAQLQAAIEAKLHERHPELKELENRRNAAMEAFEEVQTALRELKQAKQAAAEAAVEAAPSSEQ